MTVLIEKIYEIVNNMSEKEYQMFKNIIKWDLLEKGFEKKVDNFYATKNFSMSALSSIGKELPIESIYRKEIEQILLIINDDEIIEKLSGIRIIFSGETGVGKTTLVERISKISTDYKLVRVDAETLINPKLGQTQANIMELLNELNASGKKQILFLDEIDSLVGTRGKENDVAEYSRIIATFIKFLDRLNKNVVLFAATNVFDSLDPAVIRRFNIKVEGEKFGLDEFVKFIEYDTGKNISIRKIRQNIGVENQIKFKVSELNSFIHHLIIKEKMSKSIDYEAEFIMFFDDKLNKEAMNLSTRMRASIKRSK